MTNNSRKPSTFEVAVNRVVSQTLPVELISQILLIESPKNLLFKSGLRGQ